MNFSVRIPLMSSHFHNGSVRTAAVVITPESCGVVRTDKMPSDSFGADPRVISRLQQKVCRKMAKNEQQRKVAEQMVIRSREGDQNAMAIMAKTRTNAMGGNPIAKRAFGFMQSYVQSNPVKPSTSAFGEDMVQLPALKADDKASVILANSKLPNAAIRNVGKALGSEVKLRLYLYGLQRWQKEHEEEHKRLNEQLTDLQREVVMLGQTLGLARGIQSIRRGAPIATFSGQIAWELGE